MMREQPPGKKPFDAADYPALADFCSAYLHQDFAEEDRSAAGAAKRFLAEASGDEILQVRDEWAEFRQALRGRSIEEKQAALGRLGSSWRPVSEGDWNDLDEILRHAEA